MNEPDKLPGWTGDCLRTSKMQAVVLKLQVLPRQLRCVTGFVWWHFPFNHHSFHSCESDSEWFIEEQVCVCVHCCIHVCVRACMCVCVSTHVEKRYAWIQLTVYKFVHEERYAIFCMGDIWCLPGYLQQNYSFLTFMSFFCVWKR